MNSRDPIRCQASIKTEMLRPYAFAEQDTRSPEERDRERTRPHLDLMHRCWQAVQAGKPVPEALPPELERALPAMRAAADWTARFPQHPALLALLEELRRPPLFLLLGERVLWQDPERSDLYIPGMLSGVYGEDGMLPVPEYACDDDLYMVGLLGVAHSDDRRYDMDWLEVVLWPRTSSWIARQTRETP